MTTPGETITIDKERLMDIWACLVLNDFSEAYHQLYTAWNNSPDADPYEAFRTWWTHEEELAALKRMRENLDAQTKSEKDGVAVQCDSEGL